MAYKEIVPDVANFSCWSASFQHPETPYVGDIAKTVVSLAIGIVVVIVDFVFIISVNNDSYNKKLPCQPRCLLTSLACGDILKGLVLAPVGVYPMLFRCWPYPRSMCVLQALLLPILHQQAALTFSLLALDRYYCLLKPSMYQRVSGKLLSVFVVMISWGAIIGLYAALYITKPFFVFNHVGSLTCQPHHSLNPKIILAACSVYFPTTMITMYCYGTVFHVTRTSLHQFVSATVAAPEILGGAALQKVILAKRRQNMRTCRVMAVMSLAFIIFITPWTLRQIIAACTNYKVPGSLDYGVWIISECSGVMMLFVFWLLTPEFRSAAEDTIHRKICCRRNGVYYDDPQEEGIPPIPPLPRRFLGQSTTPPANPKSTGDLERPAALSCNATPRHVPNGRPPSLAIVGRQNHSYEMEAVGEKFWGDILERAVSSTSLQNMHRIQRNGTPARRVH